MSPRRLLPLAVFLTLVLAREGRLDAQEGVENVATGLGNRFIQTNTPLVNDPGVFEAVITHRFDSAVKDTGGGGFFGLDGSAQIGLGVEFVPLKNVAVQIYRARSLADYEFAAKVALLKPTQGLPLAIGVRGGLNWLTARYLRSLGLEKQSSGFGQVLVSGTLFDRVTLAAAPSYVQRTPVQTDVWNVPVMAQVKITRSIALMGEFIPKKNYAPDLTYQWSVMLEKRVYHHRFGLTIGNALASTIDQMIGGDYGAFPTSVGGTKTIIGGVTDRNIHFGFNVIRSFDLYK